ncbi:putative ATP-dependent RNA helicase TDRD12 isoform X2 [Myripristis murdjan]|uniref:putative ATP-dependent RNA helicase TDRD12 isoform X2 n=1 Tax=Myripristis murdjan TaxID=586833 RepID=UPI001175F871|nr:putative ATP-dependent RNA helicase TDRD12 isoform X2 [Myripristis murdjan]
MLKIHVVKVENPSCIWARVICGPAGSVQSAGQYDDLQVRMNLFYHDVSLDVKRLKPSPLQEGQVCVVYWSVCKSWCRAVVESVLQDSAACQVHCLLVDHGEHLIVPSDQVRVAMHNFLQLPFWVRRFRLAGIKPTTLQVSICEEKAELIPSSEWDSSATLYLHNLLQASTETDVVLCEDEADCSSVELYLTIKNIKICVNDDLVAKKFAYYSRASDHSGALDETDRRPAMLKSTILTLTDTFLSSNAPPAPTCSPPVVSEPGEPVARPAELPSFTCLPQSPQQELEMLEARRSKVNMDTHEASDSQSESSSDSAAPAAKSDGSGETDSSLSAALMKNLHLFRFLKFLNPNCSTQPAATSTAELNEDEPGETTAAENTAASETDTELHRLDIAVAEASHVGDAVTPGDRASLNTAARSRESGDEDVFLSDETESGLSEEVSDSRERQERQEEETGQDMQEMAWAGLEPRPLCRAAEPPAAAETLSESSSEEKLACSRLLEWLNPDTLKPDPETENGSVVPSVPSVPSSSSSSVLVHSVLPVEPISSLDDAPITDTLRRVLRRRRYALSPADSYCWSSVARGCSTLLISHSASQPLSYLPPLLSHIQLSSCFSCCTSSTGPVTVLVCPGWEKVQAVSDLLEENQVTHSLHPVTVLLGVGKDEAKAVKIPKNCLLLVTTPFTLVRLLASHCFLFLRLCHLVLDEVDQLFSVAPDQMATILQHFQKVISSEETTSCPQQLVAVAKHWSSHMDSLLANHMPDPCVIITAAEEAALYGNVQQMILLALDSSKASVLLGALDFSPEVGQKTLIVANSAEEVEDVCKAVTCTSALCLKTHERLTHQFDSVIQQWRKTPGRGTQVILVTTNECLVSLGITDATCVVHYGFPSSPRLFGSRLACMVDNFRNVCDTDHTESCSQPVRSLLLISERNSRHVVGILRYLKRTNALMPPELLSFARGVHVAREEQKNNQPLCSFLKSFGVCRDSSVCPHRHRFNSQLDHSVLPASGIIQVLPLYIKTASVYCGRIVRKDEGGFDSLASEMAAYYAENKTPAKEPQEGGLYAVQEDERFHRVKVLSVPDRGDRLFFSVLAYFVDEGREEEVKSHQLLQLPAQFHSLPGQAVEIIVCQVKPADAEPDWHPKVTRAMSQKIRGLQHRARAVLSLGNTVFVDPMVRVTEVPGMKTLINEYNVQSEILSSGMGVSNPQHVDLLKALCREGVAAHGEEASHVSGLDGGTWALEVRMQEVEEELAEAFRAAESRNLASLPGGAPDAAALQPEKPVSPESDPDLVPAPPALPALELHDVPVCDENSKSDVRTTEQIVRNGDIHGFSTKTILDAHLAPCENGLPIDENQHNSTQIISKDKLLSTDSQISFHPQVRWYQRADCMVLTVKLMSPECQRCDFYPDRVVYSGRVNGRVYRADLELHANIAADRCCWEMKSNEPVIKLVKQQQGHWDRLLRNKNIFVSYDLEHIDEEEPTPNGVRFVGNTGEDGWYVHSDSDSDSD